MAYKLLAQEEKQRQTTLIDEDYSSNKGMVFAADYRRNIGSKNHFQGSRMTFCSPNGNKLVVAGKRPFCNHCRFPGHTIETCYKLHGYPPNFAKGKGKPVAAVAHIDDQEELGDHTTHVSVDQFNSILKAL